MAREKNGTRYRSIVGRNRYIYISIKSQFRIYPLSITTFQTDTERTARPVISRNCRARSPFEARSSDSTARRTLGDIVFTDSSEGLHTRIREGNGAQPCPITSFLRKTDLRRRIVRLSIYFIHQRPAEWATTHARKIPRRI